MKKTSFAALFAAIATSRFITGVRSESWQMKLMEAGKGEDVKWLFVQMGDKCILQKSSDGNIILKSKHFLETTEAFSDRPFRYEMTIDTEEWFGGFTSFFKDGPGMPNAALTFVKSDESVKQVVVSVLVKGMVKHQDDPDGPTFLYKMEQSEDQASELPLDDILQGGDKVVYDHCSIFIDC